VNELDPVIIQEYVNQKLSDLHQLRIDSIRKLGIESLLVLDSYLFKARDKFVAGKVISTLLDEFLAISEEKFYEDFFKDLVVFIVENTLGGWKSSIEGVDLEFIKDEIHYLTAIKPEPRWASGSSLDRLKHDLNEASTHMRRVNPEIVTQPVLGMCFGRAETRILNGWLIMVGKDFWKFISGHENLYTDIIEPIDSRARQKDELYMNERSASENRFSNEVIDRFCDQDFKIDWPKLVEFNSGNFDLDRFLP
jgi:hypothetical protein